MGKPNRKVYPVPELIRDDHIRIEGVKEGMGAMDNSSRLMRVPLMDTPACRHVRAHEMAHARFSPEKPICPAGVELITIQRVEDMRMNTLCRQHGLHDAMDAPIVTDPSIWERLLTGERENLTAGISTYNTGDWPEFVERAKPTPEDVAFIRSVANALASDPSWRNTQRQAQAVEAYLRSDDSGSDPDDGDPDENPADGNSRLPMPQSGGSEPDDSEPDDSEPDDDSEEEEDPDASGAPVDLTDDPLDKMVDYELQHAAEDAAKSPFERGIETLERLARDMPSRDTVGIVPAVVTVQRMPKRLAPSKFKSRAKVPADRGMVPMHMNRYCADKAIFAGRGRKRDHGGTILIDASGSMSISDADVDNIMDVCPLGTIATYNARFADSGNLWVIAKNGKRATGRLTPLGAMNLIDVAAVEWMVKQPGPYYWVCDGFLTGKQDIGEGYGRNVYARCIELVKQHGIIMVPELEDLPAIMKETL